jgi:DNA-binding SARP family transcriptional activator
MTAQRADQSQQAGTADWQLQLLGGWRLTRDGQDIALGYREQRLIALLALDGPRPRSHLAGTLWPQSNERRARANLRDTLWHLHQVAPGLVVESAAVGLSPGVLVDVDAFHRCRAAIAADPGSAARDAALELLSGATLLPGWYEDWVLFEQERIEQLRLRALEALAEGLIGVDNDTALAAAMAAVHLAPLRDRAQHALLRVHLSDGNYVEAVRLYRSFSERLHSELGLDPSPAVVELIASAQRPRSPAKATQSEPSAPIRNGG